MFYFFLFCRLSQSTKLHPRVLLTSIAKTQRGKFSRDFNLYYACPLAFNRFFLSFCKSIIHSRYSFFFHFISFSLYLLSLLAALWLHTCTHASLTLYLFFFTSSFHSLCIISNLRFYADTLCVACFFSLSLSLFYLPFNVLNLS